MRHYDPHARERAAAFAAARRRSTKRDAEIRAPYKGDDPISKAAYESGGVLIRAYLKMPEGPNGGCGAPTHVEGTNGGTLPCGSNLTQSGVTEPYYCGHCATQSLKP